MAKLEASSVDQAAGKLLEKEEKEFYIPSKREKELVGEVFNLFRDVASDRNRNFDYFDGRNLIDFIEDSVQRFVTNIDEREDIEDWQARIHDPFTRNKIVAILAKVASMLPQTEFFGVGDEDIRKAQILRDLKEHSDYMDDNEELLFYALLECVVKGTVVAYEGYQERKKKVRDIKRYDSGSKIEIKEGEEITRKLFGEIVPLEDFYPSSVGIRKIKDMPYCFWRTIMPASQFKMKFAQYEKAKNVEPYTGFYGEDAERPFYLDYISEGVPEGSVELIRYYNKENDEFVLIANGVWLNPLEGEEVMPLPFAHKELPFWKAIYEPLGADFFYGKSMPDKLKSMQDVINVLHNMMLDQGFLTIFPPILVDGLNDEIEDDFLRPGRRIPVTNASNYKELAQSSPNSFHQFILEFTKRVMEETSVDAVNQGIAGVGERTTATEIERAAEAVTAILGLFAMFVKWGIRDKDRIRAKNILQFYTKPLIERVLGEGANKEFKQAFNVIKIEDTTLSSGKRGTKIIELYGSKEDMPTRPEIQTRAKIVERGTGKRTEILAITPEYIRNFEFDVKLVPNRRAQMSKALEKALLLEKARVYMEFMPEFIDKEELAMQIAEAYGDIPGKIVKKPEPQQTPMIPGMEGGQGGGGMGVAENMVNALGAGGGVGVRQMMQET